MLDVVVADAVNLAAAAALLAGAAWQSRKRKKGQAFMWFPAFLSLTMPFTLLYDLGTKHHWPAGHMHDLLIARRIGALPELACLAMFCITLVRNIRRAATARASRKPTAI